MAIANELQTTFDEVLKYGDLVRLKYYNVSFVGSYYDDGVTLTQSGSDLWASGLIQPIGASDSVLLQQGKILNDDVKVYIGGNIQTSGLGPIKVGLGSPPTEHTILSDGQTIQWDVNGSAIYKKMYCRYLTNGSFVGE